MAVSVFPRRGRITRRDPSHLPYCALALTGMATRSLESGCRESDPPCHSWIPLVWEDSGLVDIWVRGSYFTRCLRLTRVRAARSYDRWARFFYPLDLHVLKPILLMLASISSGSSPTKERDRFCHPNLSPEFHQGKEGSSVL